jgi:hypothetical protein
MEQTKMTLTELKNALPAWEEAVIVFTKDSFNREYSEIERSYQIHSTAKYFKPFANGNSLFGNCLDGKDNGVRLEHYMASEGWKVEYCYIVK